MSTEVEPVKSRSIETAVAVKDQMGRYQAFLDAMKKIPDPRFSRPVPRFLAELPYIGDDDEIAERIIAKMMSADDPYAVIDAGETLSGKSLVGKKITVNDIRVNASDKQGGWAGYLVCDITLGDAGERDVMNVGAKQAVMKLAYAYVMGDLPITGTMSVVTETGRGNTVIDFIVDGPMFDAQRPAEGDGK